GAIGSGPYTIKSVSSGLSTIVLVKNPNYWVNGHASQIPAIAQPAHIPEIVIKYGLSHTDRLEDFDDNTSQISEVGPSSFKQIISGFYDKSEANGNLVKSYKVLGAFYISMNTQRSYTKNLHFRVAFYDSLNYAEELTIYNNNYNGTPEAYLELGPLSPQYGKAYYNPDSFPLPKQNITAAIQNLTIAGDECHFYVVLPNGTKIGDKSGTDLSSHTFTITGTSPPTALESEQVTIAIDSFDSIGLKFTAAYVTEGVVGSWNTAAETPHFVDLAWEPDFSDPVGQQLMAMYDIVDGGIGNKAWVDNSTLQHYFNFLDFINTTEQVNYMKNVSKIVYEQYAYIWLPVPYAYYFVQPYIHDFQYNTFMGYFYNLMYISYNGSSNNSFYTMHNLNYNTLNDLISCNVIAATKFFQIF
ncbi:ABC transporter substrate-binding protein, partial [Picrophilus oshimae]